MLIKSDSSYMCMHVYSLYTNMIYILIATTVNVAIMKYNGEQIYGLSKERVVNILW